METSMPVLTTNYKFYTGVYSLNTGQYVSTSTGISGSWTSGNLSHLPNNQTNGFYYNPSSYYYAVSSNQLAHSINEVDWEILHRDPISNLFYNVFYEPFHQTLSQNLGDMDFERILILKAQTSSDTAFFRSSLGEWRTINLPDSKTWITATFLLTWNTRKIVVLANNTDKGAYSDDDGITWMEITLPANRDWSSITVGDHTSNYTMPKFVAVARNTDKGAFSTNGIDWVEFTLPAVKNWSHVTFVKGHNKFYAIADGSNQVAFGYNNQSWEFTTTTLPFTGNYSSITSFFENGYGITDEGIVSNCTVAVIVKDSNQGAWQPVSNSTDQNTPWQTFTLPFSSNWGTIRRFEIQPPLPWQFLKPYWLTKYAMLTTDIKTQEFLVQAGTQSLSTAFWNVFPKNSLSARNEILSSVRINARSKALAGFNTWVNANSASKSPERQAYRSNLFNIAKQEVAAYKLTNYNTITALTYSKIIQEPVFINCITILINLKEGLELANARLNEFTTLSTVYFNDYNQLASLPR